MKCRSESSPRALALPAFLASIVVLAAFLAAGPPSLLAQESASDPESTSAPAAPAGETGAPEEEWLIDEPRGVRYRIEQIDKVEGTYRWIDEDTIRFHGGVYFEVVDHDEDSFWVKAFSAPLKERKTREEKSEEEKAAELERLLASYQTDIATVDRLSFQGFENGLPRSGQWRQGMDIADMNEDGHLDIVFGPSRKSIRALPNIFLGDGQGNWRLWREATYPPLPYDYGDAAAGDLNGDGHLDLVLSAHLRGLMALVGDGKGGFTEWSTGIRLEEPGKGGAATTFSSRAIELTDWNRDGRLDILAFGEGPKGRKTGARGEIMGEIINTARGIVVYVNQGDGTWRVESTSDRSMMIVQFGDDFALADFNRDGQTDIALASRMRNNKSLLGIADQEGLWSSRSLSALRARTFVGAVATADHDGDDVAELFIGYQTHEEDRVWRTGVDVFKPDQDLNWQRRLLFASEGRRGITSAETGDLDGDGHLDLVTISGDGEVWVFLGDDGFFVREESPELPPPAKGCRGYALRLQDLDGDGSDEIVAGFAGEPTGLLGIPGYNQPGCEGEGSLRAWKAASRAETAAPATSDGTPAAGTSSSASIP